MSRIEVIAIYENPSDYPGLFVARSFVAVNGTPLPLAKPLAVVPTLEEARAAVRAFRPDAVCFARNPNDDPVVVESWL